MAPGAVDRVSDVPGRYRSLTVPEITFKYAQLQTDVGKCQTTYLSYIYKSYKSDSFRSRGDFDNFIASFWKDASGG
jgi:hypothetical protein